MKIGARLIYLGLLAWAGASCAAAQDITWGKPTPIASPSDIDTNGAYVDALQTHAQKETDGSTQTVATITNPKTNAAVKFNVYTGGGPTLVAPGIYYSDGTFSITADANGGTDGSNSDATDYQRVLDGCTYVYAPRTGTVSIVGLKKGDSYEVQVWASAGYRPTTYTSGTNSVDLNKTPNKTGEFVIGTFTAQGSTEIFTYKNSYKIDVPAGEINAISLRDVSPGAGT
jgi:hypothetical protein